MNVASYYQINSALASLALGLTLFIDGEDEATRHCETRSN